ncbi:MAG: hypothetical protein EOP50_05535 [Sphingobacteriales bacterium]|nr:MAG: hypothetical protein EOP50_05535 [Sphingobacteriales bacterium]
MRATDDDTPYGTSGWNRFEKDSIFNGYITHEFGDYAVHASSSDKPCVTVFRYRIPSPWRDHKRDEWNAPMWFYADNNQGNSEGYSLNWTSVREVKANGTTVEMAVPPDPWKFDRIRIGFGSEELATRAAFAMQVIKQSCDPTAKTGF